MPITKYQTDFPLTDGMQRVGIPTIFDNSLEESHIANARTMSENVLRRMAYETFYSLAAQSGFKEEIFDCEVSCEADIEHPHKVMWTYMDINVEELKADLQNFVDRKLAPFEENGKEI